LFSIGTIAISTHTKPVPKPIYIPKLSIIEPILKQPVEPICVLAINLTIPPNIVKNHLFETNFHPEMGEMIIDETLV
jgi:hypothetical protein